MDTSLSLYAQLKEIIIAAIEKGKLKPGDQLPSQRELCEQYNMSHMTVRRAISELINEGLLVTQRGKGIYVAQKKVPADSSALIGFAQQMARLGIKPSTRVLESDLIAASTVLAHVLRVQVGTPLVYLKRMRFANEKPLALSFSYLPHSLCPGLLKYDLAKKSLFATLHKVYGLQLVRSSSTLEAVLADEEQAHGFETPQPFAILVREQITYLDSGQPIEFSRTFIRGDQYLIRVEEGGQPIAGIEFEPVKLTQGQVLSR